MNIRLKKACLHHFMSFGDAEIDFRDRGFCSISGRNLDPRDSAKSNGSGKSAIFNAVSYALTGATLQGLRSNLANKAFDDGCRVSLEFDSDGHSYAIERTKDDREKGTSLRVSVDGVDRSGKGIRESQAVLESLLPDLTPELLGSVVMLGQGMPMRFSANTPSGRKEVLEHLSKSDYMISDLKDRIAKRQSVLDAEARRVDDSALVNSTKAESAKADAERLQASLAEMRSAEDSSAEIARMEAQTALLAKKLTEVDAEIASMRETREKALEAVGTKEAEKASKLGESSSKHSSSREALSKEEASLSEKERSLSAEIARMESIKDVCPTCGQKIPGVVKPDTSMQRNQREETRLALAKVRESLSAEDSDYVAVKASIEARYSDELKALRASVADGTRALEEAKSRQSALSAESSSVSRALERARAERDGAKRRIEETEKSLSEATEKVESFARESEEIARHRDEIEKRRDVISRLSTMAKRDFRGILLGGVIEYVGAKAKEFSVDVFGTDAVEFALDGNDIRISYLGKDYENLSGGERQRIDLIVQFALRDMLCSYLGFSANVLVLDEIADALDAVSCERAMSFISSRMSDVESVFIISHHADELDIPLDGQIVVTKDERGISSIE